MSSAWRVEFCDGVGVEPVCAIHIDTIPYGVGRDTYPRWAGGELSSVV